MNSKRFLILAGVVVVGGLVLLSVFFYDGKNHDIVNGQISGTPSSTIEKCNSDVSSLNNIPSLPSGFEWSVASTTLDGEFYSNSFDNKIALKGETWIATSTERTFWLDSYGNYVQARVKDGWSVEIDPGGHKLMGIAADGPISSSQGFLKTQNDNFRAIWIMAKDESRTPALFEVFVSDITPVSQVIPDYKPNCPSSKS
jgi:hypothetical protein